MQKNNLDRLKAALKTGNPSEIKGVLFPGPRPRFRAIMHPDPDQCVYLVNDLPVTEAEFNRLQAQFWIPGVSRTVMETPDSEDE